MEIIKSIGGHLGTYVQAFRDKGFSWGLFWNFLEETIKAVESFTADLNVEIKEAEMKGVFKQDLAVQIILEAFDESGVDIPMIPSWLERAILKWAINKVVKELNNRGILKKN